MISPTNPRFTLLGLPMAERRAKFLREVKDGLTASPKHLPCCYFYDRLGSQLFEAICELPEYYLTRAETAILTDHAADIAASFPRGAELIELGSGNAAKTRLIIEAFLQHHSKLRYVPIDICRTALEDSARQLLQAYPALEVLAIAAEYQEALEHLRMRDAGPKLVLWLGSNIGNLDRAEAAHFLQSIRATLGPDDRILVGIDLRKDRNRLEAAYDDPCGVTAAFNRNLLARINRELGGHFDLRDFDHKAIYNDEQGRIEMYLVCRERRRVLIEELDLSVSFSAGEAIHTENSYKHSPGEMEALANAAGLHCEARWYDPDELFAVNVLKLPQQAHPPISRMRNSKSV